MSKIYPTGVKQNSEQRMHTYLTETLLKRVSAVIDKSYGTKSNKQKFPNSLAATESGESKRNTSTARDGGITSYRIDNQAVELIQPTACVRGYKVLTFIENEKGKRTVFDLLTGTVYCVGRKERVTKGGIMFTTKSAAMSERYSPKSLPLSHSKLPTSRYPRILCQFDAWGRVRNRFGGVPAAEYEYMKFMGVVQYIDPICPHSQSSIEIKREPNFFGKPDNFIAPRNSSPAAVKVGTLPLA